MSASGLQLSVLPRMQKKCLGRPIRRTSRAVNLLQHWKCSAVPLSCGRMRTRFSDASTSSYPTRACHSFPVEESISGAGADQPYRQLAQSLQCC